MRRWSGATNISSGRSPVARIIPGAPRELAGAVVYGMPPRRRPHKDSAFASLFSPLMVVGCNPLRKSWASIHTSLILDTIFVLRRQHTQRDGKCSDRRFRSERNVLSTDVRIPALACCRYYPAPSLATTKSCRGLGCDRSVRAWRCGISKIPPSPPLTSPFSRAIPSKACSLAPSAGGRA